MESGPGAVRHAGPRSRIKTTSVQAFGFLRAARSAASLLRQESVTPGVGVDVDEMAVLGEAVDEGAHAGGAREDGAPLLVGELRG